MPVLKEFLNKMFKEYPQRLEDSCWGGGDDFCSLKDSHTKLCTARYECFAGSNRRVVNQITGSVSRYTLLNIPYFRGVLMGMFCMQ
jgi:hypothetical protein